MQGALVGLLSAAAVILIGATGAAWRRLVTGREGSGFWTFALAFAGYSVLTAGGVLRGVALGHLPYGTLADSLLLFAWSALSGFLYLAGRFRLHAAAPFFLPLVSAALLYAVCVPLRRVALPPALASPWVVGHVLLVLFGYGSFALAALAAGLYLLQEKGLKARRLTFMHHQFPPLRALEALSTRCVALGFTLVTLGLVCGAVWSRQVWGAYMPADPKLYWSLVTWGLYGAYLLARSAGQWRGRRTAFWTIYGFAAVLFTYVGLNWLSTGLHRF